MCGLKLGNGLRGYAVQHVTQEGNSGDDTRHLVQEIGGVLLKNPPVSAGRFFPEKGQFTSPFAQGQEHGNGDGADDEPVGDGHINSSTSSDDPQEKPGGNAENVQDDHFLEPEIIGELHRKINQQNNKETQTQKISPEQG